ncbi:MAG: LLM class flavin-dependent oxidoreductase [Burkholderiaceae bacterium]|jgi:FMN-dependent oxidoreductase (nitrilotriacetate monooxygenase family)|nr:LLM class flavin-dependent oxidoreductase [Burkholderiaceae bacterium]
MTHNNRQLHLNLNFLNAGTHAAAWRWPGNDPKAFIDIGYFTRVARLAEEGTFDAIFLADRPAISRHEFRPFQALEPTVVLTAIAAATRHIGLIGTVSSSFNEPYNIARRFATLDHVSAGKIGINIVTSADKGSAVNFGLDAPIAHALRYERAIEFADVLGALWDSWDDDALVADPQSGVFVDPARVHAIHHRGKFFTVQGPLNVPRSPQGRPVVIQAGGSDDGLELAARHADGVFVVAHTRDSAATYGERLRARAAAFGRRPQDILILPGLVTIIGSTDEEARRREEALAQIPSLEQGIDWLEGLLQTDLSHLDPDAPLPESLSVPADGSQTFAREALTRARRDKLTLRQLIRAQGGGGTNHRIIVGTPQAIADSIEDWFRSGAADGFNLMPDVLPSGLEDFVEQVVPLLRKKGIFRTHYTGTTLREHFGLARPAPVRKA